MLENSDFLEWDVEEVGEFFIGRVLEKEFFTNGEVIFVDYYDYFAFGIVDAVFWLLGVGGFFSDF